MIGRALDHYRITAPLGAGGMGEVWRAEDTKLGREVALKVLPEDFADDPERHARFEREAKVLASLNHLNIATLFGLEHLDGKHVLIMELVEGEGLDERIARGPIALDEAVSIALQIAEALEAAHEAGIVHRDLKPANIRIRPDGTVKVLDFGLAKTWESETADSNLSLSPTVTRHATVEGVILGTAAYMSPEQARGKAVDRRADIWAFGVVLWEMLTGRSLFSGDTVSDVMAAVLRAEPDYAALPPDTPFAVRRLVRRCLARDLRHRLQWIGDARVELEEDPVDARSGSPVPPTTSRFAWVLAAAGFSIAFAAVLWSMLKPIESVGKPIHLEMADAGFVSFSNTAISSDGRLVAYASVGEGLATQLKVRSIDSFVVRSIPDTDDAESPFFSPDGKWLVYLKPEERAVEKVSLAGGQVQRLPDVQISGYFNSGTWHPDGYLILSGAIVKGNQWQGLVTVPDTGGVPQILTTPQGAERRHYLPEVVPGSPWVLYTYQTEDGHFVAAVSMETGENKLVLENATTARYLRSGHLLAFRPTQNDVVIAAFDPASASLQGQPVSVLSPVGGATRGTGQYAVADTGTLIYNPPSASSLPFGGRDVVLIDRSGQVEELEDRPSAWSQPRFSADGNRLLLRNISMPNCDLWTFDLERRTATRITFEDDAHDPLWHATGDEVLYAGNLGVRRGVFRARADGSGSPVLMIDAKETIRPASWTADGRRLCLGVSSQETGEDVWVLDLDLGPEPFPFLNSRFGERHPAFSANGRWIAYTSDESGHWEVFIRPYPGPGGRSQISTDGGTEPLWSPDGTELFYRADGKLMAVKVIVSGGEVRASAPEALFDDPFERNTEATPDQRNYDVSPDGSRFAMIRVDPRSDENRPLRVVVGWLHAVLQPLEND